NWPISERSSTIWPNVSGSGRSRVRSAIAAPAVNRRAVRRNRSPSHNPSPPASRLRTVKSPRGQSATSSRTSPPKMRGRLRRMGSGRKAPPPPPPRGRQARRNRARSSPSGARGPGKVKTAGKAAGEQARQADESMKQGLEDLKKNDTEQAAKEGERSAQQLEQLSEHLAAMNARDFGQRLEQARQLAQQLATREET